MKLKKPLRSQLRIIFHAAKKMNVSINNFVEKALKDELAMVN